MRTVTKHEKAQQLACRLRRFNNWRRGAETEPPSPREIGADLDAAVEIIESTLASSERRGSRNAGDEQAMEPEREYDAGLGTTPGMWGMLSDLLVDYEKKLPGSLNNAIYALRDGEAFVALKADASNAG
jgi:hypothetical protein